jgi:hypothetical protein
MYYVGAKNSWRRWLVHTLVLLHTCSIAHLFCCTLVLLHTCSVAHLFYCTLVLLHTCSVAHLFCCTLVLLHTCSIAHLFYCTLVLLHTCSAAHLFLCNYTVTRLVRNVGWFLYSTPPLEQYTVRDQAKTETQFSKHSVTPQFQQFTLLAITGVQREIMGAGSPTYATGVFHLNCVTSYSRIFQFIHLHTNLPH